MRHVHLLAVALLVALASSVASAETCTFASGASTWSAIGTISGVGVTGCTPTADDDFIIPSGATVTVSGDIDFVTSGDAGSQVEVQSGGTLSVDTTAASNAPVTLTLNSGDAEIGGDNSTFLDINGGTLQAVPSYAQAGRLNASPGFVTSRSSADTQWIAPAVYTCATDASVGTTISQDCSTDGKNVLFRWAAENIALGSTSPRTTYVDEAMNNVSAGMTVCMTSGLAKGLCGEVLDTNDSGDQDGPHDILVEFDGSPSDLNDAAAYPLAYRASASVTTSAAAAKGELCLSVAGAVVTATTTYAGRAVEVPGHEKPFRIERTEVGVDCAGTASTPDSIYLVNPTGLLADVASSATLYLTMGVSRGDSFEVFAQPFLVNGSVGTSDGRVTMRNGGAMTGEGWAIDRVESIIWDDTATAPTAIGWTIHDAGLSTGDIFAVRTQGGSFSWLRFMGDCDGCGTTGGAHPIVIRPESAGGVFTVTDTTCTFHGDDCTGTQGQSAASITLERTWAMHVSRGASSAQLYDGQGATPSRFVAKDIGCINGNHRGGSDPIACILNYAPGAVSRMAVVGCDDCGVYRGSSSIDTSPTNVFAAGLKQAAGGDTIMYDARWKQSIVRNSQMLQSASIPTLSEDGADDTIFDGVELNQVTMIHANETETWNNVLFRDISLDTVGTTDQWVNFQACASGADCTVNFTRTTFTQSPGVPTPFESWLRWPNLATNHADGAHTFYGNCFVDALTSGTGVTLNYIDFDTTEFGKFGVFDQNLWYNVTEATPASFTTIREWASALNTVIGNAGTQWRGIDPGLGPDGLPVPGGFADTQDICAGSIKRPGLTQSGEYLTINGVTPRDLGFTVGGGGVGRTFAPTPFGHP